MSEPRKLVKFGRTSAAVRRRGDGRARELVKYFAKLVKYESGQIIALAEYARGRIRGWRVVDTELDRFSSTRKGTGQIFRGNGQIRKIRNLIGSHRLEHFSSTEYPSTDQIQLVKFGNFFCEFDHQRINRSFRALINWSNYGTGRISAWSNQGNWSNTG